MDNAVETMKEYVKTRDALLNCVQESRRPDCQGCEHWTACKVRKAWRRAWNAMNAALRPGETEARVERFRESGRTEAKE